MNKNDLIEAIATKAGASLSKAQITEVVELWHIQSFPPRGNHGPQPPHRRKHQDRSQQPREIHAWQGTERSC